MRLPKLLAPEPSSVATETLGLPLPGADWLGSKNKPVVPPPLGTPACHHDLWADTEAVSSEIPGFQTNVIPRRAPEPRITSGMLPEPAPSATTALLQLQSLEQPE